MICVNLKINVRSAENHIITFHLSDSVFHFYDIFLTLLLAPCSIYSNFPPKFKFKFVTVSDRYIKNCSYYHQVVDKNASYFFFLLSFWSASKPFVMMGRDTFPPNCAAATSKGWPVVIPRSCSAMTGVTVAPTLPIAANISRQ